MEILPPCFVGALSSPSPFQIASAQLYFDEPSALETDMMRARLCLLEQVNGDEDDAKKGQTRAIPGTSNPVWEYPPEVFILTAVEGITFEVRAASDAGIKNTWRLESAHDAAMQCLWIGGNTIA